MTPKSIQDSEPPSLFLLSKEIFEFILFLFSLCKTTTFQMCGSFLPFGTRTFFETKKRQVSNSQPSFLEVCVFFLAICFDCKAENERRIV